MGLEGGFGGAGGGVWKKFRKIKRKDRFNF